MEERTWKGAVGGVGGSFKPPVSTMCRIGDILGNIPETLTTAFWITKRSLQFW